MADKKKRTALVFISIFVCLAAVGLALFVQREKRETFEACVVAIDAEHLSVLVIPVGQGEPGYLDLRDSERLMKTLNGITEGDLIEVTFGGMVTESYPVGYRDVSMVKPTGGKNIELARETLAGLEKALAMPPKEDI